MSKVVVLPKEVVEQVRADIKYAFDKYHTRSSAQLAAGEMTAQEWRTVSAIVRYLEDTTRIALSKLQSQVTSGQEGK